MYDFSMDKLSDLLNTATADGQQIVHDLDINLVSPDPTQVRQKDNEGLLENSLNELANSIKAIGVTNPILVRDDPEAPGKFMIICGERRYRASLLLGNKTIPAIIKKINSAEELLQVQITENLQRVDLNLEEVARGVKQLTESGLKNIDIAKLLGKPAATIVYYLSVDKWPDFLKNYYHEGKVGNSPRTIYEIYLSCKKDPINTEWFLKDRIAKNGVFTRADSKDLKLFIDKKNECENEQKDGFASVENQQSLTVNSEEQDKEEAPDVLSEKEQSAIEVAHDITDDCEKSDNGFDKGSVSMDAADENYNNFDHAACELDFEECNQESSNDYADETVNTEDKFCLQEFESQNTQHEEAVMLENQYDADKQEISTFDGDMTKEELNTYLNNLPLNLPLHVSVNKSNTKVVITLVVDTKN